MYYSNQHQLALSRINLQISDCHEAKINTTNQKKLFLIDSTKDKCDICQQKMTDQYLTISFILYMKSCYQIAFSCSINHKQGILICSMS